MSPFAQEIIGYLFKLALAGLGFLTVCVGALQLYFKRAISHEAKKAVVKKRVNDEDTGAKAILLERFERDLSEMRNRFEKALDGLQIELEANRKAMAHGVHSNSELSREQRYLYGRIEGLTSEISELRKVQPKFMSQMSKFVVELGKMQALKPQPINRSGGLSKVAPDTGEEPS